MSCVIKHPPPQNKPRCIYGDERFQSLKIDQWQEPEVTRSGNRTKTNGNYPSAIHSDMHTYTFIHTHWTLSVSFMHSFTSLACSENTTCECQQHPLYSVNCQTVFNSHYFTSEVCTWQENFFFSKHTRCTPKTRSANTNMHTHTYISRCERDYGEEDYAQFGLWHLCADCGQHCHDGTWLWVKLKTGQKIRIIVLNLCYTVRSMKQISYRS